jgi:hypothetical protein
LNPCDTFTISEPDVPNWLWIVVCKDSAGTVLIANLLPSNHKRFDPTCAITPEDCEQLDHDSFVDYEMARIVTLEMQRKLSRFIVAGKSISDELLNRIRDGWLAGSGYDEHQLFLRKSLAEE